MKSQAANVDEYMMGVPEKRVDALNKIRKLCREILTSHEEGMNYKMPSYIRNGQVEVAFASQSQSINVYFLIHEVMINNKDRLKGLNHGKGCIRYSNPDKINFDLIRHLLNETLNSNDRICI